MLVDNYQANYTKQPIFCGKTLLMYFQLKFLHQIDDLHVSENLVPASEPAGTKMYDMLTDISQIRPSIFQLKSVVFIFTLW